ncbi:histidinol-phosphate aminotransferase [Leptolyngbya sp. Heron Island J]|uniref:histidinol-phosphate transaminase n=1 Tax=Leptolyngbya sp. Heron Island J TaxID=1385935 RepID=UPI0003B9C4B6|nr:histidinol-phosphate transaminase [Leptolyngbya sp. Heron Island J]ESA34730.1 histidinol-phosphate aminotransferase [Leptolyngbya sp. Heron Island J]
MQYFQPLINTVAGHNPSPYLSPETSIIKLNSNENPYPPSPQTLAILKTLDGEWLRRYPDPYSQEFCQAAAVVLGVPPDWIIVGNGCDDLLSIVIRACADRTRPVVYPTPTYGLYHTLAELCGVPIVEIGYDTRSSLPIDKIVAAQGALTLIASPNSPSGHQIPLAELHQLAARVQGVLVIDEAYVDFAAGSALSLVKAYEHVMVLRTLSKGYSLAGLRFGFGIAQPPLLAGLFKVKDSYGVDAIATRVAAAAIADQPYTQACVAQIKTDRKLLSVALKQLGFQVPPSQGNFVLATHSDAQRLHNCLKNQGIWVRPIHQLGRTHQLRITIGTPDQHQQLLKSLSAIL